jgi:hypothetical protein
MNAAALAAGGEAAIWSRIIRPDSEDLSPEAAGSLLKLDFDDADRARLHELVAKGWSGVLSAVEEAELESYCRVGQILDLLHEKARRSLGLVTDEDAPLQDPLARADEKRRSREEDRVALLRGEKTRDELRRENGLFVFPHARIDLDGADALA